MTPGDEESLRVAFARLEGKVDSIIEKQDASRDVEKDFETRMRAVESTKSGALGITNFLAIIAMSFGAMFLGHALWPNHTASPPQQTTIDCNGFIVEGTVCPSLSRSPSTPSIESPAPTPSSGSSSGVFVGPPFSVANPVSRGAAFSRLLPAPQSPKAAKSRVQAAVLHRAAKVRGKAAIHRHGKKK